MGTGVGSGDHETGREKQGSSHAMSGVCPGKANHRLSARCRVSRTPANDRTWMPGWSVARQEPKRRGQKRRKFFPQHCASLYSALRASPLACSSGPPTRAFFDAKRRSPCFAQAQGDRTWSSVERMRSTHGRIYGSP